VKIINNRPQLLKV